MINGDWDGVSVQWDIHQERENCFYEKNHKKSCFVIYVEVEIIITYKLMSTNIFIFIFKQANPLNRRDTQSSVSASMFSRITSY